MVNMTLAVPEELHKIIKKHTEIRWSEVARRAMQEQATRLEILDSITAKSKLTAKDAEELGNKIKMSMAKRHGLL